MNLKKFPKIIKIKMTNKIKIKVQIYNKIKIILNILIMQFNYK